MRLAVTTEMRQYLSSNSSEHKEVSLLFRGTKMANKGGKISF